MTEKLIPEHLQGKVVAGYFEGMGYKQVALSRPWRHIVGELKKSKNSYFLKLATTEDIAKRTLNEFVWNELVNHTNPRLPIAVPIPHESGEYNGLFWFTSEFVHGQDLANPTKPDSVDSLLDALPQVAEYARAILELQTVVLLPRDQEEKDIPLADRIMGKIQVWKKEIKTSDITSLEKFIGDRLPYVQMAPQHGDFVPWHFKKTSDGKLYLIDAEAAAMKGLKFYDIAYFYHRVYTKLKRPDVAKMFMNEIVAILKLNSNDRECLRLVLAQRIVGGYFDAGRDNITSIELQDKMRHQLLDGEII